MKNFRGILALICMASLLCAENYYEVIGINKDASAEEIRGACRKKKFATHPDKGGDTATFQNINNICEILQDDTKRAEYNKNLTTAPSTAPAAAQPQSDQLAIEGSGTKDANKKDDVCFAQLRAKIDSYAKGPLKGKTGKLYELIGKKISSISLPDQATSFFGQDIGVKDMSFLATPKIDGAKCGLGFSATMVLNQFTTKGTVYVYEMKEGARKASLEIELPDFYTLTDMFPSIKNSIISRLHMPKGKFVLSEVEYEKAGWKVKPGFNFVADLDLSGPVEILDDLRKKAAELPGVIAEGGVAHIGGLVPKDISKLELKASIPLKIGVNFTQISKIPKSVTDIFNQIYTKEFYVAALPAKQELELKGSLVVVLGTQPQPLELVLGGKMSKNLVAMSADMKGMIDLKWFAIGNAGLQIDIDSTILPEVAALGIPFTGLGIKGEVDLGKDKTNRALLKAATKVSLKSADTTDVIFDMDGENLRLSDFIVFMSKVVAKQSKGRVEAISEDKMPNITIKKAQGYIATADSKIAEKEYKRGMSLDFDAQILSQEARVKFYLNPDPKNVFISGAGYVSPIDLKVIKITGSDKNFAKKEGAAVEFELKAKEPKKGKFKLNGAVMIPDLSVSVGTDLTYENMKFNAIFDASIQALFTSHFDIKIDPKDAKAFEAAFRFKGDFAKFMNEMALPEVRKLQSDAVVRAQKADADWRRFQGDVGRHKADVERYRQERDKDKARLNQAQQVMDMLLNVEEAKRRRDADAAACKANPFKNADRCFATVGSGTEWLAKAGLREVSKAEVNSAKAIISGYQEAVKGYAAATQAFEDANRKLQQAASLKSSTEAVMGALTKVTEFLAKGAEIFNLKEAAGNVKGKELAAGKLPMLEVLNIEIKIPAEVPKIGGKSKSIVLKNLQFDFKNPKNSSKSIAKSLAESIKDMVK